MPPPKGCHYGFEPEDIRQEAAVGALLAERCHPGNKLTKYLRSKVRVARHRHKEGEWKRMRVTIVGNEPLDPGIDFDRILLHEILDLLPYVTKEEVLTALIDGDGNRLIKMGRIIRETLPGIEKLA